MDRRQGSKRPADSGQGTTSTKRQRHDRGSRRKFLEFRSKSFTDILSNWRELPRPDPRKFDDPCGKGGQTATCARMAIDFYNRTYETRFKYQRGGDSNAFHSGEIANVAVHPTFYVHLNFEAIDRREGRHIFFAELKGTDEPSEVIMTVDLGKNDEEAKVNSGEHTCIYCTGLRHPMKTFKGLENVT